MWAKIDGRREEGKLMRLGKIETGKLARQYSREMPAPDGILSLRALFYFSSSLPIV
jgi:hypothetical protein